MIRNPIHLRLAKLAEWQHRAFMVCLCERMYPNYALFCQQTGFADTAKYLQLLDLVWESLLVKSWSINFDAQLEKFLEYIPVLDEFDTYSVYPALDACEALSELLHSYISGETTEHAIAVSEISLHTVATFEMTQLGQPMSDEELKENPAVNEELDLQWEIFRLLRAETSQNFSWLKGLKTEIREAKISNIGVFLSN